MGRQRQQPEAGRTATAAGGSSAVWAGGLRGEEELDARALLRLGVKLYGLARAGSVTVKKGFECVTTSEGR